MSWDRLLWGVEFGGDRGIGLIGCSWRDGWRERKFYDGEPTRALMFQTRRDARAWVAVKNAEQAARKDSWGEKRYRVVRVRETVRKA